MPAAHMLHSCRDERKSKEAKYQQEWNQDNPEYQKKNKQQKVAKETEMKGACGVLLVHCSVALCASADCPCFTGMRGYQRKQSIGESGSKIKLPRRQKLKGACGVLLVYCGVTLCASSLYTLHFLNT